jgi:hypothetical protein
MVVHIKVAAAYMSSTMVMSVQVGAADCGAEALGPMEEAVEGLLICRRYRIIVVQQVAHSIAHARPVTHIITQAQVVEEAA